MLCRLELLLDDPWCFIRIMLFSGQSYIWRKVGFPLAAILPKNKLKTFTKAWVCSCSTSLPNASFLHGQQFSSALCKQTGSFPEEAERAKLAELILTLKHDVIIITIRLHLWAELCRVMEVFVQAISQCQGLMQIMSTVCLVSDALVENKNPIEMHKTH